MLNFKLKQIRPLKDTPDSLGYKKFDKIMYVAHDDGVKVIELNTVFNITSRKEELKFPSDLKFLIENVSFYPV